jgi:hypothetical protein
LTILKSATKYPNLWKHAQSSNLSPELSHNLTPNLTNLTLKNRRLPPINLSPKKGLPRDLLAVEWVELGVIMLLEAPNPDKEVAAVVLLEARLKTTSKAAGITKKMRDLLEALAVEVTSGERREHAGVEELEVVGGKDLLPRKDTPTLTSTLLPEAVALDPRLK